MAKLQGFHRTSCASAGERCAGLTKGVGVGDAFAEMDTVQSAVLKGGNQAAKYVARLVECLPSMYKALGSTPNPA